MWLTVGQPSHTAGPRPRSRTVIVVEHDVHVIIEQGLADLRGLPPRRCAQEIIDHCAHSDYRPAHWTGLGRQRWSGHVTSVTVRSSIAWGYLKLAPLIEKVMGNAFL